MEELCISVLKYNISILVVMCFYAWYFAFMIIQDNLYTLALGCIYMAIVLGLLFKNLHSYIK